MSPPLITTRTAMSTSLADTSPPLKRSSINTGHTSGDAADAPDANGKKARTESSADTFETNGAADRIKLRTHVLLLAYSGKGYLGMQRNPGCKTIELDLMTALCAAGVVPPTAADDPRSIWFQRAARTDKGVSAAGQIVSLRLISERVSLEAINERLPRQIRVLASQRVTNRFDAKLQCSSRTYLYVCPTFAFAPLDALVSEEYRITPEVLANVERLLKSFEGTHMFFNFTSRRTCDDPSNMRYIMSMSCGRPFVINGLELIEIRVKGQSFMLHQIRMMVGAVVAVSRGAAAVDLIERACQSRRRIDMPKLPGLGLVLDQIGYEQYNERVGSKGTGTHPDIDWQHMQHEIDAFKQHVILADIVATERRDKSMLKWLSTVLVRHTFEVREDNAACSVADPSSPSAVQPSISLNHHRDQSSPVSSPAQV